MSAAVRDQVALAADLPLPDAQALFARICPWVGVVKVGLSLFVEHGPKAVEAFTARGGRVFLDLKLHDIPNTVGLAAERAAALGVAFLTVHAQGGRAMLQAALEGARTGAARAGVPPPRILAVTVLTSLGPGDLEQTGLAGSPSQAALRLAQLAKASGVDGLVCSVQEARTLRAALGPSVFLCTPGIRPRGAEKGDQTRAETPAEAVRSGSDLLVVGRPIYAAADPEQAARALHDELGAA